MLAHVPKLICFGNNCALRSRSLTNALAAPGAAALRALRASQGRALRATVRLRMCQSCFALATPERFEAEAWLSRCMRKGGLRKFGSKCCGRSLARCRSWRSAGPTRQTLNRALARSLAHVPKLICFGNNCALRSRSLTNALAAPGAAALRALRASQGRALRATVRLRMCQSCFALATPERFEAEAWLSRCMRKGGLRKFGSKCCGRSLARCRSWRSAGPTRQTLNRALARSLAHVPKLICFGDISTLRRRSVTNVWRR